MMVIPTRFKIYNDTKEVNILFLYKNIFFLSFHIEFWCIF